MVKNQTKLFKCLVAAGDLLLTILAFYAAFWLRFRSGLLEHSNPEFDQYMIILGSILPLWIGLFSFFGLYEFKRHPDIFTDLGSIIMSIVIGVVFISAFTFFYREIFFSRLTFLLFGGLNTVVIVIERVSLRIALQYAHKHGYNLRQVIVVGAGPLGLRVAERIIDHPQMGYRVVGFLDDIETNDIYKDDYGLDILGNTNSLNTTIEKYHIDRVIIALPGRATRKIARIVESCEMEGIETDIVPDFFSFIQPRTKAYDLAGLPLISVRSCPVESSRYRHGKRCFDVAFALTAMIVCSPLFLVIAAAIKLTSSGPVFFKQERIGGLRQQFYMSKFRSMHADAEQFDQQAGLGSRNDPRTTRIGHLLRKWSLDELPQFWNVLRGDMSIVGPRPERTYHVKQFKTQVPSYMVRHQVKTGITGWAQINGWRGDTSIAKRIEYDIFYIENWSFRFDLKIILLTVTKGFVNDSV